MRLVVIVREGLLHRIITDTPGVEALCLDVDPAASDPVRGYTDTVKIDTALTARLFAADETEIAAMDADGDLVAGV